ncbi:zinc ribbon domain-containing protein [Synechococcus sp. H55.4]|uniref:zinc ribbon domain-containing protein n=1 Tax=Synechococcus sp. H55.4 TaxID=2964506 RepID=UPI0039C3B954
MFLPTQTLKPSQRCPECGAVHKEWAELSNRYHVCSACGFAIPRDRGTVMVFYNVATNQQPGLGTSLVSLGCFSSTMASATLCEQRPGTRDGLRPAAANDEATGAEEETKALLSSG